VFIRTPGAGLAGRILATLERPAQVLELDPRGADPVVTTSSESLLTPLVTADERAFLKVLGKNVRVRRVICEISQEQLAHRAGMSRNFVSSIERGAHGVDIVRVVRIAVALGVTLPELLPDIRDFAQQRAARRTA
jgi:DNA-binding XRE family transcriptional regulator